VLHDGDRAAAEFLKFIDYQGVVMNFPLGALARLRLARAFAMQGDTAKARGWSTTCPANATSFRPEASRTLVL